MSIIITIEGKDGSGKATHTCKLERELIKRGYEVERLSFPNYKSTTGKMISEYLQGDYGQSSDMDNLMFISSLFALDRKALLLKKQRENKNNIIYICDRYTESNILYQTSRLDNLEDKFKLSKMIYDYEEMIGIPKSNIVIYLDVRPEICMQNLYNRYRGEMKRCDINENLDRLKSVHENSNIFINKYNWKRLPMDNGIRMNSREENFKLILSTVLNYLESGGGGK